MTLASCSQADLVTNHAAVMAKYLTMFVPFIESFPPEEARPRAGLRAALLFPPETGVDQTKDAQCRP